MMNSGTSVICMYISLNIFLACRPGVILSFREQVLDRFIN